MKNIFLIAIAIGVLALPVASFAHEGHVHLTDQQILEKELKELQSKSTDDLWVYLAKAQTNLGQTIAKKELKESKINVLKLKTALTLISEKKDHEHH
ncbi:MAG: hypothetical protein AB7F28_00165 [Candidatus Margulisiibacteriota bacterium]